jgi:4-hydroxybenzoate polyprenyltransferase
VASKFNDPVQTIFYGRHRLFLLVSGALSSLASLALGLYLGWEAFAFILVMSLMGLFYNLKIISARLTESTRCARLREIPGSKTVFTALAWGVLAALIPVVCSEKQISAATAVAFFFVAGLVFIRTGLFEILAIEGDRVVGKETLAIALGPKYTLNLLSAGATVLALMLIAASWVGLIPPLGYLLSLCCFYALAYLTLYRMDLMESGLFLESMVEGNMILAGLLAFLLDPHHGPFWTR